MQIIEPKLSLAKKLTTAAWIVSGVVFLLVVAMRRISIESSIDFTWLPGFYSILNALAAVTLIMALIAIKRSNAKLHRRLTTTALVFSALFLVCYVLYHITNEATSYCGEGPIRTIYFILLISHILLAATTLPFILVTYIRAFTNQFALHKKMARWVFPLWLYVAITGPVIYLMISPCYSH
ncbi:MAG: DUF420 domain-containing protein [Bacteroidota bacterium]